MDKKEIFRLIQKIKRFKEKNSNVKLRRDRFFPILVKASFVKTYELIFDIYNPKKKLNDFFLVPNLRGICEDLIVLGFLNSIDKADREELTKIIFGYKLFKEAIDQANFFHKVRPFQNVVSSTATKDKLRDLENEARQILKKYKCQNRKGNILPNTRILSEKQNLDLLTTVYDFLFRLTSRMVHFNPSTLMAMGWGDTKDEMKFSTINFKGYYYSMVSIYGLYLFCLYFELFKENLKAPKEVKNNITILRRKLLMLPRWPEMVTFEEMNQSSPKNDLNQIVHQMIYAEKHEKGFLLKKE